MYGEKYRADAADVTLSQVNISININNHSATITMFHILRFNPSEK